MKRRGSAVLLVLLTILLAAPSPAHAAGYEYSYVNFVENCCARYHGVSAHWNDQSDCTVYCHHDAESRLVAIVNAYALNSAGWMQITFAKVADLVNGTCVRRLQYTWEWKLGKGYNSNFITSPSPPGTHTYGLTRTTVGCAAAWCWHFLIDGVSKHTCCNNSNVDYVNVVNTYLECSDAYVDTDCDAVGQMDIWNQFQRQTTDNVWHNWSGQDSACVDTDRSGRGKWTSATTASGGFNISFTGSIQTHCQ